MATAESTRSTARHHATTSGSHRLLGRIGSWQLVRLLSEGNFTRVYQARPAEPISEADDPPADSRPAAYVLKVLRNEWWREPQAIDMQRREAWIGSLCPACQRMSTYAGGGEPFSFSSPAQPILSAAAESARHLVSRLAQFRPRFNDTRSLAGSCAACADHFSHWPDSIAGLRSGYFVIYGNS